MSNPKQLLTDATVIGVDLHSQAITACVITTRDGILTKPRFFEASTDTFMDVFKKHSNPGDILVVEATTNAFHFAEHIATLDGRKPIVVTSECVADKERPDRVNDRIDAENLALAHLHGATQTVWQPSAKHRDMRQLFFARRDAVKNATQAVNRMWALFNARGIKTSKAKIKKAKKLDALLPPDCPAGAGLHLQQLWDDFTRATAHRDACDALIARHAATNPDIQRLLKILGIHVLTAFALIAFIEDIKRFETAKKLVRYLGLNPCVNTSGKSQRSRGSSDFGRHDLKALLIESAQSAYRFGKQPMHAWARRVVGRKGVRNIGIAALARKLVTYVWHLLSGHELKGEPSVPDISSLRKFSKLAFAVGKEHLKTLGFDTPRVFIQSLTAFHFPNSKMAMK